MIRDTNLTHDSSIHYPQGDRCGHEVGGVARRRGGRRPRVRARPRTPQDRPDREDGDGQGRRTAVRGDPRGRDGGVRETEAAAGEADGLLSQDKGLRGPSEAAGGGQG